MDNNKGKVADEEVNCYWLGMEFDALSGRRFLCIFDAGNISQGPLCKLHLNHPVPWGIHSEWVPGLQVAPPQESGQA